MGQPRVEVVRHAATGPQTRALYARVFGRPAPFDDRARFPAGAGPFGDAGSRKAWARMRGVDRAAVDRAFANVGKAIAAYERKLEPAESRFDRFVGALDRGALAEAEALLDERERHGLRLFLDEERTLCLRCHHGPLFTNQSFHHVATEIAADGRTELGRFLGIQAVLVDPFNCLGAFSDAAPEDCTALRFLDKSHLASETGKFKTPTLRGLSQTGPYMHDGRFATLAAVVDHYRAPPTRDSSPHELLPLDLAPAEADALVAFLGTLDGGVQADARWLRPPEKK